MWNIWLEKNISVHRSLNQDSRHFIPKNCKLPRLSTTLVRKLVGFLKVSQKQMLVADNGRTQFYIPIYISLL